MICKAWKIINNENKLKNLTELDITSVSFQPISKVLLVEDDLVFQETFARVFAKMAGNWEIQAFQDGASALKALSQPHAQFTLALIDIGLPDISGIDAIASARQRFATLIKRMGTTGGGVFHRHRGRGVKLPARTAHPRCRRGHQRTLTLGGRV